VLLAILFATTTPCNYYINPYYNANPTAEFIPSREETFDQVQPKLSIKYSASEDLTYYASYGVGFRSGGFNSQGTTATLQEFFGNLALADGTLNLNGLKDSFDKEISKAFELGFKSRLLDNALAINGAVYVTDTEDMQDFSFFAGPFGSLRVVTNIDEAEIRGAEIDFKWRASEELTIYGGYGITDTEITAYSTRPYTVGNNLPYIPEETGNLGVQYINQVSAEWELTSRLDVMYAGETWFSPVQDETLPNFFTAFGYGNGEFSRQKRDPYAIANINFVMSNGVWTLNLWGKNVTNEEYLEEIIPAPEFGGSFIHDSYGRAYGLNVSRKF
jgi:iron complex outermembrane receptor protein